LFRSLSKEPNYPYSHSSYAIRSSLHFLAEYFPYSVDDSRLFNICQREQRNQGNYTYLQFSLSCYTYNNQIIAVNSVTASIMVNHTSIKNDKSKLTRWNWEGMYHRCYVWFWTKGGLRRVSERQKLKNWEKKNR